MTDERTPFALDTNVLFYASDDTAGLKQALAREVIARAAPGGRCMLPLQCVGELFNALTRKRVARPQAASTRARDFLGLFPILEPVCGDAGAALDLAAAGAASYWDGLLLATVGRAGCAVLLSEDMQDGSTIAGVTIRNPFSGVALPASVSALLA